MTRDDGERVPASTNRGGRGRRCLGSARLGEILVRDGFISADDLATALREQEAGSEWRVGRLLVQHGAIDETTLVDVVAQQFDLEVCDPRAKPPTQDAIDTLPRDAALQLHALPMAKHRGRLTVAVSDPPTRSLKTALERAAGCPVELLLCRADHLGDALEYWYGVDSAREQGGEPHERRSAPRGSEATEGEDVGTTDRVVRWLFENAVQRNALFVRVEVDESAGRIRFGTRAETHDQLRLPRAAVDILVRRLRQASGLSEEPLAIAMGRIITSLDGRHLGAAVGFVPTSEGTVVSLRLDSDDECTTQFPHLGLDPTDASLLRTLISGTGGLVVVAVETDELAALVSDAFVEESRRCRRSVVVAGPACAEPPAGVIHLPADSAASTTIALQAAAWLEADVVVARVRMDRGLLAPAIVVTSDDRTVVAVCEHTRVADAIVALYGAAGGALLALTLRAVVRVAGDAEGPTTEVRAITEDMREALRDPHGS